MLLGAAGAATTKAAWKFLTSLLKTARAVGVEDGLCFAGAKMDFKFLEVTLGQGVCRPTVVDVNAANS